MTDAVAPPYLDRAVIVARMAWALKGAPDIVLHSWSARMRAYGSAGIEQKHAMRDRNDEFAVASELARRKAMEES
jgi:hypothetical protein